MKHFLERSGKKPSPTPINSNPKLNQTRNKLGVRLPSLRTQFASIVLSSKWYQVRSTGSTVYWINPSTTGNPFFEQKLLGVSTGRVSGALKGFC